MDRSPLQQLDVHDGLESTLTMLKHKLETGIEVVRDYDRSLPELPAYAGELNQVWTNLVDNAVDAMDGMDGTGRLTVRTARDGDQVLVEIGDNGAGVPEAAAAHVLEPFYTTKPVGKGTGLGLDICWRIVVQRHHGDLRVTSAPGTPLPVLIQLTGGLRGSGAASVAAGGAELGRVAALWLEQASNGWSLAGYGGHMAAAGLPWRARRARCSATGLDASGPPGACGSGWPPPCRWGHGRAGRPAATRRWFLAAGGHRETGRAPTTLVRSPLAGPGRGDHLPRRARHAPPAPPEDRRSRQRGPVRAGTSCRPGDPG